MKGGAKGRNTLPIYKVVNENNDIVLKFKIDKNNEISILDLDEKTLNQIFEYITGE
jgi:hypothetical protein